MDSSSIALDTLWMVMNETSNNYNAQTVNIFTKRSENFLNNYDIMIICESLEYWIISRDVFK